MARKMMRNKTLRAALWGVGGLTLTAILARLLRRKPKPPPIIKTPEGKPDLRSCEVVRIETNHAFAPHEVDPIALNQFRETLVEWTPGGTSFVLQLGKGGQSPLNMHTHNVLITAEMAQALQRGDEIVQGSTEDDGHRHVVRIKCTGPRE